MERIRSGRPQKTGAVTGTATATATGKRRRPVAVATTAADPPARPSAPSCADGCSASRSRSCAATSPASPRLTLASIYLQKAHGLSTKQTGFIVGSHDAHGRHRQPALRLPQPRPPPAPGAWRRCWRGPGWSSCAVPLVRCALGVAVLCLFQACHLGSYAISEAAMLERVDPAVGGGDRAVPERRRHVRVDGAVGDGLSGPTRWATPPSARSRTCGRSGWWAGSCCWRRSRRRSSRDGGADGPRSRSGRCRKATPGTLEPVG